MTFSGIYDWLRCPICDDDESATISHIDGEHITISCDYCLSSIRVHIKAAGLGGGD